MMSFRCLLLAILLRFTAYSQEIKIDGSASDLAGKPIEVLRYMDPVSRGEVILAIDTIDQSGDFDLSFDLSSTSQVWMRINRFMAPIVVEPNGYYQIEIPNFRQIALLNQWRPGQIEYVFVESQSEDINTQIIEFDSAYVDFFQRNARLIGTRNMRPEVVKFEEEYGSNEDSFSDIYINYSIAEMKLSSGYARNDLYDSYLKGSDLSMGNPAFYSFFSSFYRGSFDKINFKQNDSPTAEEEPQDLHLSVIDSLLAASSEFLKREEIRQWVVLEKIKKELYSNLSTTEYLLQLLTELEKEGKSREIIAAAREIKRSFLEYQSPIFEEILPSLATKINGEKPSFLLISYTESTERMREKGVVENLLEEYGDFFQIIEISLSEKLDDNLKWRQFKVDSEVGLMNSLTIYKLPWYGWVETDGRITKDIEKPSEGLEKRLFAIRAKKIEENKIKVGQ